MSVLLPLRQWRTAAPAVLSGSRCIARTAQDVIIDGRLELCRGMDGTAWLRFQGLGRNIIHHDPNNRSNRMAEGIRNLTIYTKE